MRLWVAGRPEIQKGPTFVMLAEDEEKATAPELWPVARGSVSGAGFSAGHDFRPAKVGR